MIVFVAAQWNFSIWQRSTSSGVEPLKMQMHNDMVYFTFPQLISAFDFCLYLD